MALDFKDNYQGEVSLRLGESSWRKMFFVLSRAWHKDKILNPMRNQNSDLRIPHSDALLLNHRDFIVSEVHYEVHMYSFNILSE